MRRRHLLVAILVTAAVAAVWWRWLRDAPGERTAEGLMRKVVAAVDRDDREALVELQAPHARRELTADTILARLRGCRSADITVEMDQAEAVGAPRHTRLRCVRPGASPAVVEVMAEHHAAEEWYLAMRDPGDPVPTPAPGG